jgi:hypothetical protein
MAHYRLYCLDPTARIRTGEWIEADDDAQAIEIAHAMNPTADCELWLGSRKVAVLAIPAEQA